MNLNILMIGDIVGKPGRGIIAKRLKEFRTEKKIDFCVANAENAADGSGITPDIADDLLSNGIDVLTMGDHVWRRKEIVPYLERETRIIRPLNLPEDSAGKGVQKFSTNSGFEVVVVNLMGRTFMKPIDCPFLAIKKLLTSLSKEKKIILVDFHAEATSEKIAMGWYLDGKISMLCGTHTHIQTADERVLPRGTAYITDLGMTGPYNSVIGRKTDNVIHTFVTQMPSSFYVADGDVKMCGLIATINSETFLASSIERVAVTL